MQFNIDGRIQAVVRREDASWIVYHAETSQLPRLIDVLSFAEHEANDIAAYLDALLGEEVPEQPTDR